jgi:hypothetical protein
VPLENLEMFEQIGVISPSYGIRPTLYYVKADGKLPNAPNKRRFVSRISNPQPNPQKVCLT